jgi:hypothetical protein
MTGIPLNSGLKIGSELDLTRLYSQKSFFRSKHISIPHPPDQLLTICHQPYGTMPTIFL